MKRKTILILALSLVIASFLAIGVSAATLPPAVISVKGSTDNNIPKTIQIDLFKTNNTYTLYLPSNARIDQCFLSWDDEASYATIGNDSTPYYSGQCPIPSVNGQATYTFKNVSQTGNSITIKTYQGSVVPIFIDIIEDEANGSTIALMDGDLDHEVSCSGNIYINGHDYILKKIKGRGNYTWKMSDDKRAYNLTLNSDLTITDFDPAVDDDTPATDKWTILSEVGDRSLLCNRSGFHLAHELGIGQITTSADVWMNGEYQGCYTVTPKYDSFVSKDGYLLENDNYKEDLSIADGGDPQFALTGLYGTNKTEGANNKDNLITVKKIGKNLLKDADGNTDESTENIQAVTNQIQDWMQDAWDAIKATDGVNSKGKYYTDYIDLESFAKMYLMQEYAKSYDVCAGSIFFYRNGTSETDKLFAGPIWDLDNAMGSVQSNGSLGSVGDRKSGKGSFIPQINEYKKSILKTLWQHDDFQVAVKHVYNQYHDCFDGLEDVVAGMISEIETSAVMNHVKVNNINRYNLHEYTSATTLERNDSEYQQKMLKTNDSGGTNTNWANFAANLKTYIHARSLWFYNTYYDPNDPANCEHTFTTEITPPTCTEEGYTTYTCTKCATVAIDDKTPVIAHDYQPTYDEEDDIWEDRCTECGEKLIDVDIECGSGATVIVYYTQDIEGLYEENAEIAHPRNSDSGLIDCSGSGQINFMVEMDQCHEIDKITGTPKNYNKFKQDETPYRFTKVENDFTITVSTIHRSDLYEEVVTTPTCTEGGFTTYICSECGDSYIDNIVPAIGHDLIDHPAQAATYDSVGWKAYQTCSRCDYSTYEEIPTLERIPYLKSHQLLLSGQIGVNYYMLIPSEYAFIPMVFNVGDRTVESTGKLQDDGRYKFTCFVSSVEMAEPITATFTYSEDADPITDIYSVKDYLEVIINNVKNDPAYTAATPLAKTIYNYGYYAMLGLPGGAYHPAMPGTYIDDTVLIDELTGYSVTASLDKTVITDASYSLDLESETMINIYLTTETELNKDNVTVTTADEGTDFEYTVTQVGNRYRVQITGIAAHELGSVFTVTALNDSVITASALSYVQRCLARQDVTQDTKNAAAVLYAFYEATVEYRNITGQ